MTGQLSFFGPGLTPRDTERLGRQLTTVLEFVRGAGWLSLARISEATGAPEASVSARLRDLRRSGYLVERRRAQPGGAVYLYRVSWQGVCS